MKFMKGLVFGVAMSAGAWMLCSEETKCTRNKMMKQGKKIMKNLKMI